MDSDGCGLPFRPFGLSPADTQSSRSSDTRLCTGASDDEPAKPWGRPGQVIPPENCRLWLIAAPPVGSTCTQGARPTMEDASTVVENLLEAPLLFHPSDSVVPHAVAPGLAGLEEVDLVRGALASAPRRLEASFLFAGVYDGHGGALVAAEAAGNLHHCLRSAFAQALAPPDGSDQEAGPGENSAWDAGHPGLRLDAVAAALRQGFCMMDRRVGEAAELQSMGSTAVVALVSRSHVAVANVGDSRAVLCRGRRPFRLTRDHKPDMDDERERIVCQGGVVLEYNGPRVMGMLAMSRALGDHCLRSAGVVAEPEITIISRSPGDEFLLLASDGLWDAVSDAEACGLVSRCFERAQEQAAATEAAARVAATVLMKAALDRGSRDNITVTVVDLRFNRQPEG